MAREISVVIPSYNHAAYLDQAISSALDQQGVETEVIVVDDGSKDGSRSLLEGWKTRVSDERLKIIFQPNQGAHAAINNGIAAASGEYLSILNSDDYFHPQRCSKLIARLKEERADLIFSKVTHVDSAGSAIDPNHKMRASYNRHLRLCNSFGFRFILLGYNLTITTGNFLFSRKLANQIGEFNSYRTVHDWDFALRSLAQGRVRFMDEELLSYRVHESNTISQGYDDSNDTFELLTRYFLTTLGPKASAECPSPINYPVYFQTVLRWLYPAVCDIYEAAVTREKIEIPPVSMESSLRALNQFESVCFSIPSEML